MRAIDTRKNTLWNEYLRKGDQPVILIGYWLAGLYVRAELERLNIHLSAAEIEIAIELAHGDVAKAVAYVQARRITL